jgi:hypothetical protein
MNSKLAKICKETIVAKSQALFWHLSGDTDLNYEKSHSRQPAFRLRFETWAS